MWVNIMEQHFFSTLKKLLVCVTKVIICVFTPIVVYRTLLDAGVENMISVVGNMISVTLSKKKLICIIIGKSV